MSSVHKQLSLLDWPVYFPTLTKNMRCKSEQALFYNT